MVTADELESIKSQLSGVNRRIAQINGNLKKRGLAEAHALANAWNLLHDLRDGYVRQIKSAKLATIKPPA